MPASTFRGTGQSLETPQTDLVVLEPAAPRAEALTRARWPLATRLAFRFSFLYFGLYVICGQMLSSLLALPDRELPELSSSAAILRVLNWVAAHVLGIAKPIVFVETGSGDRILDFVLAFTLLIGAAFGTAIWSVFDRKRDEYVSLNKWFRLFLRLSLAATMAAYGTVKVIPAQMKYPPLARLLERFGDFSIASVLWFSVGASPAYEIFAGGAELTAAILLFVPRLRTLGALVAVADAVQICALNMTYDIPVKLFSLHLILISLVLVAPEASRLANVLVLDRAAGPSKEPPLFENRRAVLAVTVLQLMLGAYIIGAGFNRAWRGWQEFGGGAPRSPLYGIWNVEKMWVDGVIRPPLLDDDGRWRRLVFESPRFVSFQRMDETLARFGAAIDTTAGAVALTNPAEKEWKANLSFQRPDPGRLILDGEMDGHRVRLETRLLDPGSFVLAKSRFHWVQEAGFWK